MANAVGQVTLTVTVAGMNTQTTVTVLSGTTLPVGTVLWSAPPVSGFSTQQIVQAVPTSEGPDLYSIDTDSNGDTLVRSFKSTGEQMWQTQISASQGFFAPAVGDNFGGLLLIGSSQNGLPSGVIIDLDGQTGAQAWQYATPGNSSISFGAVGLDGSVYAVETDIQGNNEYSYLNSLNGLSGGLQARIQLPESLTYFHCPSETATGYSSRGLGPAAVAPDGAFYAQAASSEEIRESNCEAGPQPFDFDTWSSNLSLMRVSPDGGVGFISLDSSSVPGGFSSVDVIPDGQGGVLAAWNNPSNGNLMADVGGGAQTTFPIQVGTMVLGDNNTAFATNESSVVAFNVPSLVPTWTYTSTGGALSFVNATAGGGVVINDSQQGVIQLDSSGNAGTPVPSLQGFVPLTLLGWGGISSDPVVELIFNPNGANGISSVLAASPWPETHGNDELMGQRPKFDFELVWCTNRLCADLDRFDPDLDVAFTYYQFDPTQSTNPVTLTPAQINTIQLNAVNALKIAFANYPRVSVGTGRRGSHVVYVVGEYPGMDPKSGKIPCASTNPISTTLSRAFYLVNMEQAQFALNLQSASPTQALVQSIGEGIGNNAAHEIAHQVDQSASGNAIAGLDDSSLDTYNGGVCNGDTNPGIFTGVASDGTTPIHWEPNAAKSLSNILK
jgi:hypothetical protein